MLNTSRDISGRSAWRESLLRRQASAGPIYKCRPYFQAITPENGRGLIFIRDELSADSILPPFFYTAENRSWGQCSRIIDF
jgi:hypothetical protein